MNTRTLQRLANISRKYEMNGLYNKADNISKLIVRIAANWQSINTDIPMLERMWEFRIVDKDFNDAQRAREKHPRYKMDESMGIPRGVIQFEVDCDSENSIEKQLHPDDANEDDAGVKNMFYDGHSSLMQGGNMGKTFKQIERDKVDKPYKNSVPTFTN